MTRSQKFLFFTYAPVSGNRLYKRKSDFWDEVLVSKYVKRKNPDYSSRNRMEPQQRGGISNVVFSFSDLRYFFECPYQFKLRILYGFNTPIEPAMGYGKSIHDALAEVNDRAIKGDYVEIEEVPDLIETHFNAPFASRAISQSLKSAINKILQNYIIDNRDSFNQIEFSEQRVEINLENGVVVNGRIDLVRRLDTNEVTIVDLKSNSRAQAEEVTEAQLHTYALGYQELTGQQADYVEIYELEERKKKPRAVDVDFIKSVKEKTQEAAKALREVNFVPNPREDKCPQCDYLTICKVGKSLLDNLELTDE